MTWTGTTSSSRQASGAPTSPACHGTVGAGQFLQWSDPASNPIVQFSDLQTNFVEQSGRKANTLVLGARTITQLKNHPDIIDRIKYTQRGVVTTDLLASLFDIATDPEQRTRR